MTFPTPKETTRPRVVGIQITRHRQAKGTSSEGYFCSPMWSTKLVTPSI
jgi:hypothetical protein